MLLEIEYYTEKEAFRRQKQLVGLQRSLKRGDAWFPLRVGKSYYNSLNQLSVEVFRTADEDIEHSFEFGKPVCFFKSEGAKVRGSEGTMVLFIIFLSLAPFHT